MFGIAKAVSAAAAIALVLVMGSALPAAPANAAPKPNNNHLKVEVSFDLSRVSLTDGVFESRFGKASMPANVSASATNAFTINGDPTLENSAVYQIAMLGEPSGYWVKTSFPGKCNIYNGRPAAGSSTASSSPFNCETKNTTIRAGEIKGSTLVISINRAAEANGFLTTVGDTTLDRGLYDFGLLKYSKAGSTELGKGQTTEFATVMREGDTTTPAGLARARFSYRIIENGEPTKFWVVGWSQTERAVAFQHQAMCFVTDLDPSAKSTGALDQLDRQQITPYECITTKEDTTTDNGTYESRFTIGKKNMTVVGADQRATQADLLRAYCSGSAENCGISLTQASVSIKDYSREKKYQYANNTDHKVWENSVQISETHSTTNSYGVELGSTVEADSGVGLKFSVSVKHTYGFSTASTTSLVKTMPVPASAHHVGWVEVTVPIVSVDGDIVVYDPNSRTTYLIKDVHFEFAKEGAEWSTELEEAWLPGYGPDATPPTSMEK